MCKHLRLIGANEGNIPDNKIEMITYVVYIAINKLNYGEMCKWQKNKLYKRPIKNIGRKWNINVRMRLTWAFITSNVWTVYSSCKFLYTNIINLSKFRGFNTYPVTDLERSI